MANEKSFKSCFTIPMKDISLAEKKILSALPKMTNAALPRSLTRSMRPRPKSTSSAQKGV
jgi:ferritin-like metal-binding protein YciE